jgi:S-adenosylmethionine:tRNA ribosyltransferase-isomerase
MSKTTTQQGLPTAALDYNLPRELIATRPVEPRDSARMMVLWRNDPSRIEHRHVRDLPEYLNAGDALVFNTSAVAPARLAGRKATGGHVEGLLLEEVGGVGSGGGAWRVMLRSNSRLKPGMRIELLDRDEQPSDFHLTLIEREDETWLARVDPPQSALEVLDLVGRTPLPPYILRARGEHSVADDLDRRWYQTVYADAAQQGSVAAPTAGLHFTPELLFALDQRGVKRLNVILHVGAGTFKPVIAATVQEHHMHSERYEVPPATMTALSQTRSSDEGRIIAVGTTAVRTLESLALTGKASGETDLLIAPPYEFRMANGMLTNFHLPRSTLLALVAAMIGLERVKAAYAEAIDKRYRFYSYGDAMLILP